MSYTETDPAHHRAIAQGSPALIPMLWGLRLAVARMMWGKMDT